MTTATTRQLWCKEDALNIEQRRTQNYFSLVVLNCKIMLPRWTQSLVETQWLSEFPSRRQQVFPPVECVGGRPFCCIGLLIDIIYGLLADYCV